MSEKNLIQWKCLEEKVFLDFPYLQIVERLCQKQGSPPLSGVDGSPPAEYPPHRYYVLKSRDWCNILPITEEGKIVLIRQFRAGTANTPYEFPGGVIETSDENLKHAALRELLEETGYAPGDASAIQHLGSANPNPALQDNVVHSFMVSGVRKVKAQELDPGEDVVVEEKSVAEFFQLLNEGKFNHALMLTSLFFLLQTALKSEGLEKTFKNFLSAR